MTLDLVFPVLPPVLDGIGDYTAALSRVLSEQCSVRIRTGATTATPIPGVSIHDGYQMDSRAGMRQLVDDLRRDRPDWVVVQYNPFSYGQWGFNPFLPWGLRQLSSQQTAPRIALTVHEPFVPRSSLKFTLMSTWQRAQLWSLGRSADVLFFSIDPWAKQFAEWFPNATVSHLPVGSNIPEGHVDRAEARRSFGIDPKAFVLGVFGSAHPSRLLHFVRAAANAIRRKRPTQVLYVGAAGTTVRAALGRDIDMIDTGPLPAIDVSRAFSAMDLYLAPFRKGVSTRRGSFMTGLQHGVASVSTYGDHTDAMLLQARPSPYRLVPDDDPEAFASEAVRLAMNAARRHEIAQTGRRLFADHFSWPQIADRMLQVLSTEATVSSPEPVSSLLLAGHSGHVF